jgi:hypothetical protein
VLTDFWEESFVRCPRIRGDILLVDAISNAASM